MKIFVIFIMMLVTADTIYTYYYSQEFNVLYWPSVMTLGGILLKQLNQKEKNDTDFSNS